MPTITKTCNRIQQTSGGDYQTFLDLNNLKLTDSSAYAQTELIRAKKKSPNRPALLLLSDFRFNLPTGAVVRNIEVIYNHELVAVNNEVCQIGKPTIVIQGVSSGLKATSQEGHAPSTAGEIFSRNFSCNIGYSVVNSDKFAVQFRYPRNANDYSGYLRIRNIWVKLTYIVPEFSLTLDKVKGQYNGDVYELNSVFSNKAKTSYVPWVTINLPLGFSYTGHSCEGTLDVISARVLRWNPKIYGISSDTLTLQVKADISFSSDAESYTGTFDISEALNGTFKRLDVTVLKDRPLTPPEEDELPPAPPEVDADVNVSDEFYVRAYDEEGYQTVDITIILTPEQQAIWETLTNKNTRCKITSPEGWSWEDDWAGNLFVTLISYPLGRYTVTDIQMSGIDGTGDTRSFYPEGTVTIDYLPSRTVYPSATILSLTDEELNRLGDGYTYTASTLLRVNPSTEETYLRDWEKNCRIGVFNEAIKDNIHTYEYTNEDGETMDIVYDSTDYHNLTMDEILKNTIWSDMPKNPSTYEELTVDFRYNKDYPLYIIITNDYEEATNKQLIRFTEPVITETSDYQGRKPNGNYPVPILNTLDNERIAEQTIPAYTSADTLIFYDLPLPDTFGTDDEIAIRGIEVNGNIERSDELILSSKIINQGQESRTRTEVLSNWQEDMDTHFTLGQHGDNWGFPTEAITDFKDWEIHLTAQNNINDTSSIFNYHDVNIGIYVETIEHLPFKTYINSEDLTYYGVFITDVTIPEGLKTDTDYLTVNGMDTNYAYRQAIREKDIEIEIEIGDTCDLEANTIALRDFIKLLTNERDKYNRPIPKRIEFTHYPDLYWEYILEDGVKPELEINTYKIKAKLTVPSGTAYTKTATQTHTTGFVNGLAHVNPTITIKPTGATLLIREVETGQVFQMGYTDYDGKFYEIDCENRRVYIKDNIEDKNLTDISSYVDINSDWFRLLGEFSFETTNCAIHDVKYHERW